MRLYTHQHIRGLYADNEIFITHIRYHAQFIPCTLNDTLRRHAAIFLYQIFLKGTAVYADANRNIFLPAAVNDRLNPLRTAYITRINADFICSVLNSRDCQFVIKMNIGN